MTRLRDLGRWSGGNTPSKGNEEYWTNGTVPWVSPKDMKFDEITRSEDLISQSAVTTGRASLLPAGSVLVVTRSGILSHTLPIAVTKIPVTINQDIKALTLVTGVSAKYVAYALRSSSQRILRQCAKHGTTVASVDTNALLDFEIPMVGLREQEAVVAEIEKQFSRLDEAVANLQRVKANLKRYKATVLKAAVEGRLVETEARLAQREGRTYETGGQLLQRILEERRAKWPGKPKYKEPVGPITDELPALPEGWTWCATDQVSEKITDGEHISPNVVSHGVLLLSAKDVLDTGVTFDDAKYVTPGDSEKFRSRCAPDRGDILIVSRGATIGRACRINTDRVFALMGSVILMKPFNSIDAGYLMLALKAGFFQTRLTAVSGSTAQQAIYIRDVRPLQLPLPPIAEQQRIAVEVDRNVSIITTVEVEVNRNLARALQLRHAVLQQSFVH